MSDSLFDWQIETEFQFNWKNFIQLLRIFVLQKKIIDFLVIILFKFDCSFDGRWNSTPFLSLKLYFRDEFHFPLFFIKKPQTSRDALMCVVNYYYYHLFWWVVIKKILLFGRSNVINTKTGKRQCDAFSILSFKSNPREDFNGYCKNGIALVRQIGVRQIRIQFSTELEKNLKFLWKRPKKMALCLFVRSYDGKMGDRTVM